MAAQTRCGNQSRNPAVNDACMFTDEKGKPRPLTTPATDARPPPRLVPPLPPAKREVGRAGDREADGLDFAPGRNRGQLVSAQPCGNREAGHAVVDLGLLLEVEALEDHGPAGIGREITVGVQHLHRDERLRSGRGAMGRLHNGDLHRRCRLHLDRPHRGECQRWGGVGRIRTDCHVERARHLGCGDVENEFAVVAGTKSAAGADNARRPRSVILDDDRSDVACIDVPRCVDHLHGE